MGLLTSFSSKFAFLSLNAHGVLTYLNGSKKTFVWSKGRVLGYKTLAFEDFRFLGFVVLFQNSEATLWQRSTDLKKNLWLKKQQVISQKLSDFSPTQQAFVRAQKSWKRPKVKFFSRTSHCILLFSKRLKIALIGCSQTASSQG